MFITRGLLKSVVVLCLALAGGAALAGDADLDEIAGFDLAGMPELVSSVSNVRALDETVQKEVYSAYQSDMKGMSDKIMYSGADADRMFVLMEKAEEMVTYKVAEKYKLSMADVQQINVFGMRFGWSP